MNCDKAPSMAIVQREAAATAEQLSLISWRERRTECGGLAWGRLYAWQRGHLVWLAAMTPGVGRSTATTFEIEPESYVLGRRLLSKVGFPADVEDLGMWHSHPSYGPFLSALDEEYFHLCYPEPWKVSVVLDPIRQERAVYAKSATGTREIPGFLYSGNAFGPVPMLDARLLWEKVRRRIT